MLRAALDIGSSASKLCIFEFGSGVNLVEEHARKSSLLQLGKWGYVHDLDALQSAVNQLLELLPANIPVALSSAMHGLIALDSDGKALTQGLSWADGRSFQEAEELRQRDPGAMERTGTPLHPMAWPAKLFWLKRNEPRIWGAAKRFTDLKSYLLEQLTGSTMPLDISSASATGLWDQKERSWDDSLLGYLELSRDKLPTVSISPFRFEHEKREFHLGAGDGPLGNLGTGAVTPGRIAISLGTSGAVRAFSNQLEVTGDKLFRYHLDSENWVLGGAISNGSSVLERLQKQTGQGPEEILRMASGVKPGSRGLRVYPYYKGERAPFWRAGIEALTLGPLEDPAQVSRAHLEGVAYCLRRLLSLLPPSTEPLRCTGGMFRSPIWCQLLADVTGQEVAVNPISEATALGAALLTVPDYLSKAAQLPQGLLFQPESSASSVYSTLFGRWAQEDPNQSLLRPR